MSSSILAGKKAIVFDFDGTLADTLPVNYELDMAMLKRYGASMSEEAYHELGGLTYKDLFAHYVRVYNIPDTPENLLRERQQLYMQQFLPKVTLFDHVVELLEQLKRNGVKIGIASASHGDVFERFFQTHKELEKYFEVVVTCDELRVNKPTPVVYEECLRRLGVSVSDAVIFEDTYAGLQGAREVGCPVVCFLSAPDKEAEKRKLADLTITSYRQLSV